jgi:hypothetical protein
VTDSANNVFNPRVNVTLDNTPPNFANLTVRDEDAIYSNGETVSLLATFDAPGYTITADFSPIDTSYVKGSEIIQDNDDGTYFIRYTLGLNNIRSNGVYIITITATDRVKLTAQSTIDLILDNSGPVVNELALADADDVLNAEDTITASLLDEDTNIAAAEYFVDIIAGPGTILSPVDGSFDAKTEEVTATLPVSALSEGEHTLYVRGKDATNKWGRTAKLPFVVDTQAPNIQIVNIVYPNGQEAAKDGQQLIVAALITDLVSGLNPAKVLFSAIEVDTTADNMLMYDDGSHGDRIAGDGVYSLEVTVNSGKTGDNLPFTITAEDQVPNESSKKGTVTLDNGSPGLSLAVSPLPKNGSGISGEMYVEEVVIKGNYFDTPDSGNVKYIEIVNRNSHGDHVHDSPIFLQPNSERTFSRIVRLLEGENHISVKVTDYSLNFHEEVLVFTYIVPKQTMTVSNDGATLRSPDGTTVVIPNNALLSPTNVYVKTVLTESLPKPVNPNLILLARAHEFGPSGLIFHRPVTIILTYNDSDLDIDQDGQNEFAEEELDVYYWDGGTWIRSMAESRSPENNTVTVATNHFSVYALGNQKADHSHSTEGVRVYWTHNPCTQQEGSTAVIEVENPGTISLKIYNLSGDLVRTVAANESIAGSTSRRWNGMDDFDRYVGSGIYIYLFEYVDSNAVRNTVKKPIGVVR